MEQIGIGLPDGSTIGATLWEAGEARAATAIVLLHPATAVTQRYYEGFAAYLHGRGLTVLTYDYRGTGRSRPANLRGCRVSMADWIEHDVGAVTRWAAARFPDAPLLAVGHSIGGHAIALCSQTRVLRAAVMVAAHAGVTRTIRGGAERLRVWCVMRLLTPLFCRLFGYMPGSRLGLGEDLPAGVMLQWSRWTSLPHYFYDDPAMQAAERAARVELPLLVLGFDDDAWANPTAIDLLLAPLVHATIERHQLGPANAGVPAIGHMGFFRKRCAATLWPRVADWLLSHCSVEKGAA